MRWIAGWLVALAVGVLLDATGVPLPGTRFQQFVVVGFAVIFHMLFQLIRAVDKLQRSVDRQRDSGLPE